MVITPFNKGIVDLSRSIVRDDLIKLDDVDEKYCELSSKRKTK